MTHYALKRQPAHLQEVDQNFQSLEERLLNLERQI